MNDRTEKRMARWVSQRWILDNIIRAVGPEWDQGRVNHAISVVGAGLISEANKIRSNVKKFSDIVREFERAGKVREKRAFEEEAAGHRVSARESYFAAALLFGYASWPFFEDDNPMLTELNDRKNVCYDKYIRLADHHVERVEVPFRGGNLPGLFHLPASYDDSKPLPVVVAIGGMDSFKETRVSLYGDKLLQRGFGVLTVDGPGQGEALIARKIRFRNNNFDSVGTSCIDYLSKRKEIDMNHISASGSSMGSYWVPRMISAEKRFISGAVTYVCHEPKMSTLFDSASPSFKLRYMWMSGIFDEEEFDRSTDILTLEGIGPTIKVPLLIVAGEDDDLSPIEYTYNFYNSLGGSKTLMIYEGDKHNISNPFWADRLSDWLLDRTSNKPMKSQILYITMNGDIIEKE